MKRRDALRTAVAGAGAVTIQAQNHHTTPPKPKPASAARKRLLFDDHQLETSGGRYMKESR